MQRFSILEILSKVIQPTNQNFTVFNHKSLACQNKQTLLTYLRYEPIYIYIYIYIYVCVCVCVCVCVRTFFACVLWKRKNERGKREKENKWRQKARCELDKHAKWCLELILEAASNEAAAAQSYVSYHR